MHICANFLTVRSEIQNTQTCLSQDRH